MMTARTLGSPKNPRQCTRLPVLLKTANTKPLQNSPCVNTNQRAIDSFPRGRRLQEPTAFSSLMRSILAVEIGPHDINRGLSASKVAAMVRVKQRASIPRLISTQLLPGPCIPSKHQTWVVPNYLLPGNRHYSTLLALIPEKTDEEHLGICESKRLYPQEDGL